MKTIRLFAQSLFVVLVVALASGCSHLKAVSVHTTALPDGQLLPHHIALVLDREFADYKHEYHEVGDTFIYPLGGPLQEYATQVAGKSFKQVEVVASLEKAAAMTSADIILIPHAIKSNVSIPVWDSQKETLTLVVSWTAKDRKTQNTVWLATITANGTESKSGIFEEFSG